MSDIIEKVERTLKAMGIEFEYINDETCDDGWYYLQCNVRLTEKKQ